MRNLAIGVLALVIGLVLAVPALAQGKKAKDGVIRGVDAAQGTIALEDGTTLATNAKTRITRNGTPARLADLRAGDRVKYHAESGVAAYVHAEGPG